MAFVVDASIVAAWLLPDEENHLAEMARTCLEDEDGFVPDLLWSEIRNILIVSERRNRITMENTLLILPKLREMPLKTIDIKDDIRVIQLAKAHKLSAYDATYLALATSKSIPLVTLDRKLGAAAVAEGLPAFQRES